MIVVSQTQQQGARMQIFREVDEFAPFLLGQLQCLLFALILSKQGQVLYFNFYVRIRIGDLNGFIESRLDSRTQDLMTTAKLIQGTLENVRTKLAANAKHASV